MNQKVRVKDRAKGHLDDLRLNWNVHNIITIIIIYRINKINEYLFIC